MSLTRPALKVVRPSFEAVALWIAVGLVVWVVAFGTIDGLGRNYDFRAFYCAGQLVREAPAKLYDLQAQDALQNAVVWPHGALPFYHPAYEALLFAPLTWLSYRMAYFVFFGLNVLLLGGCYLVAPRGGPVDRWRAAFVLLYAPVLMCLLFGQDSILFLLLLCVAWQLLAAERDSAAGVVVALALFKLAVVPIIAVLLCARRGWRFAAGFFGTAAGVAALCCWITGIRGSAAFVQLLARASLLGDDSVRAQNSVAAFPTLMPTVRGAVFLVAGHLLSSRMLAVVEGTLSVALLIAGVVLVRRARTLSVAFSAAVLCGVLLSPHFYGYDLAVLIVPLLLLRNRTHVAMAWICFVGTLLLLNPRTIHYGACGVILPAALLFECVRVRERGQVREPEVAAAYNGGAADVL